MPHHILKVTLAHIRPAIWRRLAVPSDFTLADLHEVLQIAFDWEDCHLYSFTVGEQRYGIPDPDDPVDELDAESITLAQALPRKGARAEYIYDFGDDWIHKISVEGIEREDGPRSSSRWRPPRSGAPVACLAGKRAGPPEDCGGPYGYGELLEALADIEHERHDELVEWIGGDFDPEEFSLHDINHRLAAFGR